MKIAVAGTGYVGLVAGVCFAEVGHNVICVDIDEKKIELMKRGISPIYEADLEELMRKNYAEGRLDYTTDYVTTIDRIKNAVKNEPDIDKAFNMIESITGTKISSDENNLVIILKPTQKIISLIKALSPKTFLVGFKLLDGVSKDELINVARRLRDKNDCDLVIANDLEKIRNGNHTAYIIDKDDNICEANGKDDIAKKLVKKIKRNSI